MTEYLAMFSNPEGVQRVRTQRAQQEIDMEDLIDTDEGNGTTVSANDDDFASFISADGSDAPKFRARY